jgi:predicted GNAT superfamily acetyltransferase
VVDGDDVRPERVGEPAARNEGGTAVAVPRDYATLKERRPDLAGAWRDAVADALEACFALGMQVAAFDPGVERASGHYALATPAASPDWSEP